MIQTAAYKMPLEAEEMAYMVKMKKDGIATFWKGVGIMMLLILGVGVLAGIGMYVALKVFPDTFLNPGEAMPDIWVICLKIMGVLFCAVAVANIYSYFRSLRKVIMDVREGKKIIEPGSVTRKVHMDDVYHVYITSIVKSGVDVTMEEYEQLREGDKISIGYSPYSQAYFGYFI